MDIFIISSFLTFHPFLLQAFHDELKAEEVNVQSAIKKGQVILRFCHPSATQIIQQWLARLKKRWDEVWKWSTQRLTRLEEERAKMAEDQELMDDLLKWIDEKENVLNEKDQEPIPDDDYEVVQLLLEEHKVDLSSQLLKIIFLSKSKNKLAFEKRMHKISAARVLRVCNR